MIWNGQAHSTIGQFRDIIHMGRFVILCLVGRLLFLVINAPISKLTQAAAGKPFLLSTYQWHVIEYIRRTGRLTFGVIYRMIYCTGAECTKKRKREKRTDKQATVNKRSKHTMKLLVKLASALTLLSPPTSRQMNWGWLDTKKKEQLLWCLRVTKRDFKQGLWSVIHRKCVKHSISISLHASVCVCDVGIMNIL